jgi:group I intron endonuclease
MKFEFEYIFIARYISMENFMPIYKITNVQTGDFYIGKTSHTIQERFEGHKYASKYYDSYLYRAFRKYGIEQFVVEEVENCVESELGKREIYWISHLSPKYNMTAGGTGGSTHHLQSWKDGMSKRRSYIGENNPMYGKSAVRGHKHTDETVSIMSEKRKVHWEEMSDDERKDRGRKVSGQNNGMFGKTPKNATPYEYNGTVYESLVKAARLNDVSVYLIKRHGKKITL